MSVVPTADRETDPVAALLGEANNLCVRGNLWAAANRLQGGLAARPDSMPISTALGGVLCQLGDYAAALRHYEQVLDVEPTDLAALQGLSRCMVRDPASALGLNSSDHLVTALRTDGVDPDLVAQGAFVRLRPSADPLNDPLLFALLPNALVTDPDLEQTLTEVRRDLCLAPPAEPPELAVALAAQGRLNEFAWSFDDAELEGLESAPMWVRAMYGPAASDEELAARAQRLPSRTSVRAGNSENVRSLYEEHPYPRWQRITLGQPGSLGQTLERQSGGRLEAPTFPDHPAMLVAGCGTGRELLSAALAWQPSSVAGFDLSCRSLAYAQIKSEQLGVDVELFQADLLELGEWDERFDVIVCTGVLHHLADPLAGWRVLRRLLRPGGVMLIGLYSAVARAGISAAQAQVRAGGWPPTPDGIRAARDHLRRLSPGDPARNPMMLRDFYYLSGCRDMLFHVQEHHFTIPRIQTALEELDLEFLTFDIDLDVRTLYETLFGRESKLAYWEALERLYPHTFLGMYQFWCRACGGA